MASATIKAIEICSGGEHVTIRITKGESSKDLKMLIGDIRSPITDDDLDSFAKVSLRLLSEGKTIQQLKSVAFAGVTITL